MRKVSFVAAFFMVIMTVLGFFPSFAAFIFANGSDSLMNFAFPNVWIQIALVFCFSALVFVFENKAKRRLYPVLMLVFVLWALSGRTFGMFPEGRIVTGWFYIPISQVEVCESSNDCEKTLYYETVMKPLCPWRIRIQNKGVNSTIFIGPLIWKHTLKILSNRCNHCGDLDSQLSTTSAK